ncbi:MAG TPA: amino acid adenylation domain-containing protein [Vicinamibacterales bacterium]|nr:amino acid adenylation domain-containing protein [Vicinamibacterales bacterium]
MIVSDEAGASRQREYWLNRDPAPIVRNPLLELLSRRWLQAAAARPAVSEWTISKPASDAILRVCNDSDLSLYILLVTMFKAVVARSTGNAMVTILSPSYRPNDLLTSPNIVILQDEVQLSGDVRSNILETRRTVVGAYSNQGVTLADIYGPQIAEDIVHNNPLCCSSNIHSPGAISGGCPFEMRFTRRGRDIICSVTCDSARFRADLITELCANLQHFIEAASVDYTVSIDAVDWLRGERLERVSAFARGPVVAAQDTTLQDVFVEQARKTPGALAIVDNAHAATYAELDATADVIARNLTDLGVEPGDTIGLRLGRPIDSVATMLAAVRCGAAFAPIGLSEPPNRLRRLLDRCRATLLVTNDSGADEAPGVRTATISRLLAPCDTVLPESADRSRRADAAAYVIFTSGTSGDPKAVVVEHRGIVNAITWKIREYSLATGRRVLPLFGYEFDGFVLNVFASLCSGATVVLMDDDDRRQPGRVAACIDDERVTDVVAAPLLYDAVLAHVSGEQLRSLARVTLAGEAAAPETIVLSKRVAPHVQVSNEYGPTENSVVSTYREELSADSVTVIGKPIDNVTTYILDDLRNLVPSGAIGEVCVGGRGLARGYALGDAIIQESFVDVRGERLYQTGDLACWLPDGNIEFRGRRERYVKLRGQRIDLEEIRAAIVKFADVTDAVVLLEGDGTDGVLCACVVVGSEGSLDGLEACLRQELPPHLIPNRFIPVSALPLSAGGKVDIRALRATIGDAATIADRALPSNDIERRLIEMWRGILETDRIGVDDSFFALGGHSLKAVRLLADIHEVFGIELRLNQVFAANTVRQLAEIIPQQSQHERSSTPAALETGDALSPAQERMLALAHEHPVSYNLPVLFALDANLDVPRLRSALQAVVDRHDALRASFHIEQGGWTQRFSDRLAVTITEQALPSDVDVERAIQSTLAPFDLETAPLFRVVLFTVEGRHAYLLFDFHHIIVDEMSLAMVLRELATCYNGERHDGVSAHSYAVHANAQQRQRACAEYEAQVTAAADGLRNHDFEPLRLPFDCPSPARRNHDGAVVRRNFSRNTIAAARRLCAGSETTDFMFFMAVFGLLLHKHTHQSAMVIGAPASVRSTPATRDLVGLCLNTVPFKVFVPSAATFQQYLRSVAAGIVDDLGRSQVEFDDVVKALRIERHFGENPLFSVMLNVVDASVTRLSLDSVGARYVPLHNGASKFDLILELDLAEGNSSFSFEFSTERFVESTIERLSDSLVTLLDEIIANPDARLSALQILRAADREQLLERSGRRNVGTYEEGSVAALFERQVRERASAIALVAGDETLTYGSLNAKANRLAHKLRALGCGDGDIVAVFCERSTAAIQAIMGAQKACAAHLPLDPFYPTTRTGKMLADSGARVLITDQDVSALDFAGTVIRTDTDLSRFSSENPGLSPRPESPAYVLYTSGTTGGPKGVMVAHRNLVTLVSRATSQLAIDHRDVWTLFHSFCFDVSVWEMFGSLLSGGRLVIVPRAITADPDQVLNLIEKHSATVVCQPPSAFYLLADAMVRARRTTSIRRVVLGGEAVKTDNVKEWFAHYGEVMLVNGYGITETTVYSTFKVITEEEIRQRGRSIGRPLSGTYVYVLAPDSSLCPVGVVGELYIGGLGVGLGYLGSPELTRARFVNDPFEPGRLLYQSGDLVRWLANGDLEYICRADTQVKVRGYRVEIAEIEAALATSSAIRQSVVVAEEQAGSTQLIGFFTSDVLEDVAQLRGHLEQSLPNYMVPSRLVQVDRIPVTPNGKVDRAQLLSMSAVAPVAVRRSEPTALEQLLKQTWANVVGISADQIGVNDSFFAIGGDSIGANLTVRMLTSQGLNVELLDLFENPKLRAFASLIVAKNPASASTAQAVSDRIAYWMEIATTRVAAPLAATHRHGAASQRHVTAAVQIPLDDMRAALATIGGDVRLREVLLASFGVSLRMWSGAEVCRIGLLQGSVGGDTDTSGEASLTVAPLILAIKDITAYTEDVASVRDSIQRAEGHRIAWDEASSNPTYRTALENGVVFWYGDAAWSEGARRPLDLRAVPRGCLLVECAVSNSGAAVTCTAAAGAADAERLQFLAEAFKFAVRETVRSLANAPTLRKPQVSLDVQPFNDVFFRDCTLQAVVAAVRYFGRDLRAAVANTAAICVRDLERSRALRARVRYVERRPIDEVLADAGVSLRESSGTADICEDLLECLSQGSLGIVKVDCYFVERQRELFHQKHGDHTILVCGYDTERRIFETIDNDAARAVQYRRTTIGFDELREAYEGYQRTFNPRGGEVSYLTISDETGRQQDQHDEAAIQRSALETLRLAHEWRDEERAALDVMHDDFCEASVDERLLMDHVEQLSFTFGEIVLAKRLLSYQLARILQSPELTRLADDVLSRLEIVQALLTKLRVSRNYSARTVQTVQTKLDEARLLNLEYSGAVTTFLESV